MTKRSALRSKRPCVPKPNRWSPRSRSRWSSSGGVFDYDLAVVRLAELNARAEDSALWNNPKEAEKVMRERTRLDSAIATIKRLRAAIDDNSGLIEMAEAEKDEATIAECEKSLREATAEARKARLETLLSGEADANNAYIEIDRKSTRLNSSHRT